MSSTRTTPLFPFLKVLSWQELNNVIQTRSIDRFSRTPEVLARYKLHLDTRAKLFASVSDAVKIDTLGYEVVVDGETGLMRAGRRRRSDSPKLGIGNWVLTPNQFPYAVEDGIEHLVLWRVQVEEEGQVELEGKEGEYATNSDGGAASGRRRDGDFTDAECLEILQGEFGPNGVNADYAFFLNDPARKTVPGVFHTHVFVRRRHGTSKKC